jgi:signal peptidase II
MTYNQKPIKISTVILLIIAILILDQSLKFYIKTNYFMDEEHNIIGNWGRLHFVENPGMAWGYQFGGDFGKLLLTLFRLVAVFFGVYYIGKIVKQKLHRGFIICVSLIFTGAVGNLIDSLFYGLIFTDSPARPFEGNGLATLVSPGKGYGTFLHGKVVDMFYFPIFKGEWPKSWQATLGEKYEFFSPVFNLADAAISVGVITILIFQNRFFGKKEVPNKSTVVTNTMVDDATQIS